MASFDAHDLQRWFNHRKPHGYPSQEEIAENDDGLGNLIHTMADENSDWRTYFNSFKNEVQDYF